MQKKSRRKYAVKSPTTKTLIPLFSTTSIARECAVPQIQAMLANNARELHPTMDMSVRTHTTDTTIKKRENYIFVGKNVC